MSINIQIIFFTIGIILLTLGFALFFPFLLDYYDGAQNAAAFGWSAMLALFLGGGLCVANSQFPTMLSIRGAFMMTVCSWLVVCSFSAVPLYMSDLGLSFTDAAFEMTTTRITIMITKTTPNMLHILSEKGRLWPFWGLTEQESLQL